MNWKNLDTNKIYKINKVNTQKMILESSINIFCKSKLKFKFIGTDSNSSKRFLSYPGMILYWQLGICSKLFWVFFKLQVNFITLNQGFSIGTSFIQHTSPHAVKNLSLRKLI